MFRIFVAFGIFLSSLSWLYFLVSNAPSLPDDESLQFPSSLEELKKTANILTRLFDHVSHKHWRTQGGEGMEDMTPYVKFGRKAASTRDNLDVRRRNK